MSDNPDSINLLLGLDVDEGTVSSSINALRARIDALTQEVMNSFGQQAGAYGQGADELRGLIATLDDVKESTYKAGLDTKELSGYVDDLAAEYHKMAEATEEAIAAQQKLGATKAPAETLEQLQAGFGVEGGMIGPAEGFEGGGGGRTGSLFGPGRAAMVAGRAFEAPGLSGLGEALYIAEGIKLASKQFEALNSSLQASGGIIPPLTDAMAGLGIPMSGILATAIPLAAAVAVAALVIGQLQEESKRAAEAIKAQVEMQRAKFDLDQQVAGQMRTITEQETINRAADLANKIKAGNDDRQATAQKIADDRKLIEQAEGAGIPGKSAFGNLQEAQRLRDEIKAQLVLWGEQGVALDKLNAEFEVTNNALKEQGRVNSDAAASMQAAAERQKNLTAIQDAAAAQYGQELQARANLEVQAATLIESGTSKSLQSRLTADAAQIQANQEWIDALKATGDTSVETTLKIMQLEEQNKLLAYADEYLKDTVLPLIQAREEEARVTKKLVDANQELNKAREDFVKKRADAEQDMANKIFGAVEKEREAETQYHQGSLQDLYERNRIAVDTDRKLEEERLKTSEAIDDILTKRDQKEVQAKINLNRQLEDDQYKINQEYQKFYVDYQRAQIEDEIDHQHKLADIKKQSHDGDMQALLDRNFLALAKSKLADQTKIDQENESYRDREAKLARHLEYQKADAETKMAAEIALENRKYQRKLDDLDAAADDEITHVHLNEQRKIAAINRAEQQKLADLTAMENYKITLLRHNLFDVEIPLYIRQEQAKMRLLEDTLNKIEQEQIRRGARERFATETAGTPRTVTSAASARTYDDGGLFGAGEPFMKGDIMEMLQFGAQGFNLGGAAMVYPLQSGSATPSKGGPINFSPVINVSGAEGPQATAEAIHHMMLDLMEEVFPQ